MQYCKGLTTLSAEAMYWLRRADSLSALCVSSPWPLEGSGAAHIMAKLREMRLYLTGTIIQLSISRPVFDRRRTKKQAFSNVFHRKRLAIYPLRWYNETVSTTEVRHKKLFRCREHRLSWYRPGLPFRAVLCRLLTCYFYNILFLSIMQLFFAFSILTISNLRQKPDGQRTETLVPSGFFVYGAPAADRPLFWPACRR